MSTHPFSSGSILPHITNNKDQERGGNGPSMYRLQMMERLMHEEVAAIFIVMIMIIMTMIMKMIMRIRLKLLRSFPFFFFSPPKDLPTPFLLQVTLKEGCLIQFSGTFLRYSHFSRQFLCS